MFEPKGLFGQSPWTTRIARRGGEGYVLHHQDLEPAQVTWWQQIPVTDVPTTIGQCIAWGTPTYLIKQALERAGRTSLLLPDARRRLAQALEERDRDER
ncbi:MAG: hypothetical protein LBD90_05045 [Bifidobacteriaceae bacterium]|nr:hypothetical protein [Bifidobacteriaceae bacterium]